MIYIRIYILTFALCLLTLNGKDKLIIIKPEKSHPGDERTITFSPEGTEIADAGAVFLSACLWPNNTEVKFERMAYVEKKKEWNA
jgi:hypothetical protein